jgi:hexosaminidase
MKKQHFLFVFFYCFFWCNLSAQNLIPQPVEFKKQDGVFRLTKATTIGYSDLPSQTIALLLKEKIKTATGWNLPVSNKGTIQFSLNTTQNSTLDKEGYTLNVSNKSIKIAANQEAGLFYALQTLYQLLPAAIENPNVSTTDWNIPAVTILDYPRFGWRGLMLDVSRHFFSKADVKRYIDDMVRYKYNVLHWHLTDDEGWRIEIKALPRLTQVGACRAPRTGKFGNHATPKAGEAMTDCGFYTQEEIKEIVAYAAARHVMVLPEVDVPGHSMAALAAYPELCCTKDTSIKVSVGHKFSDWDQTPFKMLSDNTLNPSDENVYVFLDKVFTEIAALFPCTYIHTGGDECYKGYWEQDPNCQALMKKEGIKTGHELQAYFTKRIEKIVRAKGKKLIGWDEILEGGGLASEAAVMSWRGEEGGIDAAKQGHYAVMSPNDYTYIDLIQGEKLAEPDATAYKMVRLKKTYLYDPMPEGIDPKYILGAQANLWTEKVPTIRHAEYMTYPRAWALSEVFWSPKKIKNWDNFVTRMEANFVRADMAGINYARSAYDAIATSKLENNKLFVELTTEVNGLDIYYTLDETTPDIYTKKYTGAIFVPDGNDVTLRVTTYRGNQLVGKVINFPRETLLKRCKK